MRAVVHHRAMQRPKLSARHKWGWIIIIGVPLALFLYIAARNSWRPKTIFAGHPISGVRFSLDGRRLVIWNSPSGGTNLWVYNLQSHQVSSAKTGKLIGFFKDDDVVLDLWEKTEIYSLLSQRIMARSPEKFTVDAILPDGKMLGRCKNAGDSWNPRKVYVWEVGQEIKLYSGLPPLSPKAELRYVRLLADQRTLAIIDRTIGSYKNEDEVTSFAQMQFWDLPLQKVVWHVNSSPLVRHNMGPGIMSTAAGLCAWTTKNGIQVWNYKTGQHQVTIPTSPGLLALSPTGERVASQQEWGFITLWDTSNGYVVRQIDITKKGKGVLSLDISPDGRTLATVTNDHTVNLWRIR